MEKAKKMLRDKEEKEMSECTFNPVINKKKTNAAEPGLETKIQVPETSLVSKSNQSNYMAQSEQQVPDGAPGR